MSDNTKKNNHRHLCLNQHHETVSAIEGLHLFEPKVFSDARGFFLESWNEKQFVSLIGSDVRFVQDNHSRSVQGVLRGLHYQRKHPQGKLIRVIAGSIWDVAVDLRPNSTSFARYFGCELSAVNFRQLWVPAGFAHGFLVLSGVAEVLYKTTDYWMPEHERSLLWSDPEVAIDWPLSDLYHVRGDLSVLQSEQGEAQLDFPLLSAKDAAAKTLAQLRKDGDLPDA